MTDLSREICKPVLKLDFAAHGLIESLSEFQLGTYLGKGRLYFSFIFLTKTK